MKKKKPPIIPITILVFAIFGLLIASVRWKFYSLSGEDQQKELQDQTMAQIKANAGTQPKDKKGDTSKELAALKERTKVAASTKPKSDDMEPMMKNTQPSVVMPDETVRKPVRNTATTSSQWYDNK